MTTTRRAGWPAGLLIALGLAAGCGSGRGTGEVTGTVTVDGQTPPAGSSITFIPTDGQSQTAGSLIDNGKYTARGVPVGSTKVQIRVPRTAGKPTGAAAGPGAQGGLIEESLPARYNDNTELTLDVKRGKNEKNWDLKTR